MRKIYDFPHTNFSKDVVHNKNKQLQKTLRKPENCQDFESLCKKLWGELWEIPHKIKKNGRLGQPQNGVDVYGIPKSEKKYWGIQCKGKNDNYLISKLTIKEVDDEIEKAKRFSPELEVFIIATTQSKDVGIEKYIRKKDIENRENESFEIILFCWEDIVDLIEENRQTLNWYLGINNFREKYDVNISFSNNLESIEVKPKFLKKITRHIYSKIKIPEMPYVIDMFGSLPPSIYGSNKINESWCTLKIFIKNTGNVVLEDWHLKLQLENPQKISDNFNVSIWLSNETKTMMYNNRVLYENLENKSFHYEPAAKEPMIQKSGRSFEISFIPQFNQSSMKVSWEFLARDFDKSGDLTVNLKPEFKEDIKTIVVENKDELKNDVIELEELIIEKEKQLCTTTAKINAC